MCLQQAANTNDELIGSVEYRVGLSLFKNGEDGLQYLKSANKKLPQNEEIRQKLSQYLFQ